MTNNLALLFVDEGRHDEAVPLFEEALAIADNVGGLQIERLTTLLNLADAVCPADARPARSILERALEKAADLDVPDERDSVLSVLDRLADDAFTAGRHAVAVGYLTRLSDALGRVHPDDASRLTAVTRRLSEANAWRRLTHLRAFTTRSG